MRPSKNTGQCYSGKLRVASSIAIALIIISIVPGRVAAAPPFNTNARVDDTGSGTSGQYAPDMGLNGSGEIYVTWMDDRNGNDDIYFARSLDGGSSFQTNVRVDDTGVGTSNQRYPAMAVNSSGEIYIAWWDRREGADSDLYFARSLDEGVSFGTNIRLDDTGSGTSSQGSVDLAVGNDGTIYAAWLDNRNGNQHIWTANSTNEGQSFGTNRVIYALGSQAEPSIAMSDDGIIYVVWQDATSGNNDIVLSKSTNRGYTFTVPIRVDDTGSGTTEQSAPKVAVATNGDVYVAWYDYRNGNYDIYFAKSIDDGASFGANVRVDDTGSNLFAQMGPSIAVHGNGNIYVAWYDARNGATNWDIYYAVSTNGGASFGTNIRVDDSAVSSSQTWPDIKVDSIGDVYVVWQDNRNGNYDIYFSRTGYTTPEFSELILVFLIGTIATVIIFMRKFKR